MNRVSVLSHLRLSRLRSRLWLLAPAALLSACTGMYLGVQGQSEDSTVPTEDITARADIHTITPETVYRLRTERAAAEEVALARRTSQLPDQSTTQPYKYLVAPQDILNITLWNHPELNNPAGQLSMQLAGRLVGEDGTFFYPYIGRVQAAGRTVQQIRDELARRLAEYLTEPQVDVSVLQYRGRKAFAVGELKQPGPLPITDVPMRITDLISNSGGLTEKADLREVLLTRDGVKRRLDLHALYYEGDMSQNILLREGDVLTIPEQRYNKVFVLGEVAVPQSLPVPYGHYSLSEAISDAGGLNPVTSNGSQVYVLRSVEGQKPQIWHLNANSPDALILADQFDLQPRDVVFVDAAGVTRWSRVINQLLPTSSILVQGATQVREARK